MDLLSSRPLREGSRGGRSEFSWETVKTDKDRENYLGHSLMAPVGRWQQGRDLAWYAKGGDDQSNNADSERARRAEELRKIKETEEDALAKALGLPVKSRSRETEEKALSGEEIRRAVGSVTADDDLEQGKGVGYGKGGFSAMRSGEKWEKVEPQGSQPFGENKPYTRPLLPGRGLPMNQQERFEQERHQKHRNQKHRRRPSREPEKLRTRRDSSRSRERKPRSTYEGEKHSSRRHTHERSASPLRRKRSRSRSRSRDHHRVRGEERRRNAYGGDRERPSRPGWGSRRRDRSFDRGRDRDYRSGR